MFKISFEYTVNLMLKILSQQSEANVQNLIWVHSESNVQNFTQADWV
jgi:hypothetical protein